MSIKIFITGGTFDKEYNELDGELFFSRSHVAEMLALGRSRLHTDIEPLLMVDSLKMTERQRKMIVDRCRQAESKKIVITHGTDTMVKTAHLLGRSIRGKTIVLTGAMVPYKFGSSDGMFNLGSALAYANALPPGVYIAMNGKYFIWDNVRKNKKRGVFEKIR
jgi:L-asparaginase